MNLIYRKATSADFEWLAKLVSTSEAWTCFGINFTEALQLFKSMADDTIYIAELTNEPVGFITIRPHGVGNFGAYIRMIAVDEEFRGQGIGTKLLTFATDLIKELTPNLFLICSVENIKAQALYERVGFVKVGVMPDLVVKGHDEILYRKSSGTMR